MYDSKLIKKDIAIEIMSTYKGKLIKELTLEMAKPEAIQNTKTIKNLLDELKILSRERMLMYKGDTAIINKIYHVYSPKIKKTTSLTSKVTINAR